MPDTEGIVCTPCAEGGCSHCWHRGCECSHNAAPEVATSDEFTTFAIFSCLDENNFHGASSLHLVGMLDTISDGDTVTRCRYCGSQATEMHGEVRLNSEYRAVYDEWPA